MSDINMPLVIVYFSTAAANRLTTVELEDGTLLRNQPAPIDASTCTWQVKVGTQKPSKGFAPGYVCEFLGAARQVSPSVPEPPAEVWQQVMDVFDDLRTMAISPDSEGYAELTGIPAFLTGSAASAEAAHPTGP
jgi:hypothetical protein